MGIEGIMPELRGERLVDVAGEDNGLVIENTLILRDSRFRLEDMFAESYGRDAGLDRMPATRFGNSDMLGRS